VVARQELITTRAFAEVTMVPLWITEVAPPHIRGILSNINGVFVDVGYVMASYVGVGFYFVGKNSSGTTVWRGPLALGCLPCILCILWTTFVPESPRYYLLTDQAEKAWDVIREVHSGEDDPNHSYATAEFYQMRKQLEFERTLNVGYLEFMRRPSYRKRAIIACGLTFILLSSGPLVINSKSPWKPLFVCTLTLPDYGTLLYKGLGYDTTQTLLLQAGWLATALATSLLGMLLVDRMPRNILIGTGLTGCLVALICVTALSASFVGTTNRNGLAAAVAMLFLYVSSYSIFLEGPCFFYAGEIFPTHLRAHGMTLAMISLCVTSIVWLQAAPTAFRTIGWRYYLFFIVTTFLGTVWVFTSFPNTRHKPLEEIAKLFGDEDLVMVYQKDIVVEKETNEVHVEIAEPSAAVPAKAMTPD
jgi:MFS family permease